MAIQMAYRTLQVGFSRITPEVHQVPMAILKPSKKMLKQVRPYFRKPWNSSKKTITIRGLLPKPSQTIIPLTIIRLTQTIHMKLLKARNKYQRPSNSQRILPRTIKDSSCYIQVEEPLLFPKREDKSAMDLRSANNFKFSMNTASNSKQFQRDKAQHNLQTIIIRLLRLQLQRQ